MQGLVTPSFCNYPDCTDELTPCRKKEECEGCRCRVHHLPGKALTPGGLAKDRRRESGVVEWRIWGLDLPWKTLCRGAESGGGWNSPRDRKRAVVPFFQSWIRFILCLPERVPTTLMPGDALH